MTEPVPRPPLGRRLAGLAVGLVLLVCLAYPLGVTGLFAYTSVTGCFIDCREPDPGAAILWSALAALLLALPITLGLVVAGARSRRAWWGAAAVVVLVVAGWDVLALVERTTG